MPDPSRKIRLYLEQTLGSGGAVALDRDAANYLFNVMRMSPGESLAVFNSADGEWLAEVVQAGKRAGILKVVELLRPPAPPPDLWLFFAPVKKTRTDFIVEKAVELGCRRIQPVLTRRTQSERVRIEKLRAHAVEAAEQCELVFVPEVLEPAPLFEALAAVEEGRRLYFCDEMRNAPPFAQVATPGPAAILIGPEGGFAPEEAERLKATPFVTAASLGPRVLRAETAALAALALWQSVAGDWRDEPASP